MLQVAHLVIALSLVVACGDDGGGGPRQPPTPADLRYTDFFVQNQSGGDIVVNWTSIDGYETSGVIASGTRAQLTEASQNFESPTPNQSITYLEVTDGTQPLHRQSPVDDSYWTIAEASDTRNEATLLVDASVLGLDTTVPSDSCCCEYTDVDVTTEDLLTVTACAEQTDGTCIVVQSARLTPHPCCPDSIGETCYPTE